MSCTLEYTPPAPGTLCQVRLKVGCSLVKSALAWPVAARSPGCSASALARVSAMPSGLKKRCCRKSAYACPLRSEEHTSELQSRENLVCRLLLEKKKQK